MNRWKLMFAAVSLCLAACSSALVEDPPPGAQFQPETSQEELAQMQQYQVQQGEVGVVPQKTDDAVVVEHKDDDSSVDAEGNVAANTADATKVVASAPQALKVEKAGPNFFIFGLIAAIICGAYVGVRTWANRNVPDMFDGRGGPR